MNIDRILDRLVAPALMVFAAACILIPGLVSA